MKRMIEIPSEYTIAKFNEFGYKVSHDRGSDIFKSCCPICREGKSWGRKKRCFYLVKEDLICCHNCGWSSKPYKWLKEVSGMSHQELLDEISKGDYEYQDVFKILEMSENTITPTDTLPKNCINLYDTIQVENYKENKIVRSILSYIKYRRLDTAINRPDSLYTSLEDFTHKHRLIIPFKDLRGDIVFYQSRKVFDWDNIGHYLSKKNGDKNLFGVDKISPNHDTVYVFEGPLDSFFVKNSLALGGITERSDHIMTFRQQKEIDSLRFYDVIYIMDSQWIDQTALKKSEILINSGKKVFIWPKNLGQRFKDFNQMCIELGRDEISHDFIKRNTREGIAGKVKMKLMKSTI
jgi:hypothetical protein